MTTYDDNPLVSIEESPLHGRGVFARRDINRDQWIGFYHAKRTSRDGTHVLWVEGDTEGEWTGYDGVGELRFLNHARPANAVMDGQDLYASCDIASGVEITIDYGEWFEPVA